MSKPFAIVTGASSGIGLELAGERCKRQPDKFDAARAVAAVNVRPERVKVASPSIPTWNQIQAFLQEMPDLRRAVGPAA
jgi:NAD(P)-dependent dehydrogenase (short-subunit alcohol dehydrogenase family)